MFQLTTARDQYSVVIIVPFLGAVFRLSRSFRSFPAQDVLRVVIRRGFKALSKNYASIHYIPGIEEEVSAPYGFRMATHSARW